MRRPNPPTLTLFARQAVTEPSEDVGLVQHRVATCEPR